MRLVRRVIALAVVSAALPAVVHAGSSFFVVTGGSGIRTVGVLESTVRITGAIAIDFHGDPAAGCAAMHVCEVKGSVRFTPAGRGSIVAIALREHGRRFEQGFLTIGDFSSYEQPLRTSARVTRDGVPGSLCADAQRGDITSSGAGSERRGASIAIRLLDLPSRRAAVAEVLRTRCAGPMVGDVARLLPARTISERALARGHRTLDFSAERAFAAHGLAGTLHSTVQIHVNGGQKIPFNGGNGAATRTRKRRKRAIEVSYRLERVSGQVATAVRGRGDPDLCGPFDACGLAGSVTAAPAASSGSAYLTAEGPIRRTRGELRRAVGLARGAPPPGVATDGYVFWRRDLGSVVSDLTRDGAPACSDSTPIAGGGSVYLEFAGGRVRARYGAGGLNSGFDMLRTRCPGPGGEDLTGALASGSFPRAVFRHRRVTLRLTRGPAFSSAGYSGRSSPDVTVVLRRTRVREYTFSEDLPPDYFGGEVHSLR